MEKIHRISRTAESVGGTGIPPPPCFCFLSGCSFYCNISVKNLLSLVEEWRLKANIWIPIKLVDTGVLLLGALVHRSGRYMCMHFAYIHNVELTLPIHPNYTKLNTAVYWCFWLSSTIFKQHATEFFKQVIPDHLVWGTNLFPLDCQIKKWQQPTQ